MLLMQFNQIEPYYDFPDEVFSKSFLGIALGTNISVRIFDRTFQCKPQYFFEHPKIIRSAGCRCKIKDRLRKHPKRGSIV